MKLLTDDLNRIGCEQAGALTTETGESWHPANLLLDAARKIEEYRAALIWCSGSPSFAEDGEARKGWNKIKHLMDKQ